MKRIKHITKQEMRQLAAMYTTAKPVSVIKTRIGGHTMQQLVATQDISKGDELAIYPVQVYHDDDVKNREYAIDIFKRNGHNIPELTGIPTQYAVQQYQQRRGRLPIGMFINEPIPGNRENAVMKFPRVDVSKGDKLIGSVAIATIVATRKIKSGDVVTWCYGCNYDRKYKTPCTRHC
jgi:hypothetical protein